MKHLWLLLLLAAVGGFAQTDQALVFREELRLGPANDPELGVWKGSWVSLAVTQKGDILVVDPSRNRIVHFNREGTLIGAIDGKFAEHDAFKNLRSLSIMSDGKAVAHEWREGMDLLTVFDAELKPIERKTLPKKSPTMLSSLWAPDGNGVATYYYMPDKPGRDNVFSSLLNAERGLGRIVASFTAPPFADGKANEPSYWETFLVPFLTYIKNGQGLIRFGTDASQYTARSHEYHISCLRPGAQIPLIFAGRAALDEQSDADLPAFIAQFGEDLRSTFPPSCHAAITPAAVETAVKSAGLTLADFALHDVLPLPDGRLLAVTGNNWAGKLEADLLDVEGKRVGSATLPPVDVNGFASLFTLGVKLWFVGDKAYGIEVRDGETFVVRYSYAFK